MDGVTESYDLFFLHPEIVADYLFEDLSSNEEEKFELRIAKDEELLSIVERLLLLSLKNNFSKKELVSFINHSKNLFLKKNTTV